MECAICDKDGGDMVCLRGGAMVCPKCANRVCSTPESERRAHWLRHFAAAAMQARLPDALKNMKPVKPTPEAMEKAHTEIAQGCVTWALYLLSAIESHEAQEKEGKK